MSAESNAAAWAETINDFYAISQFCDGTLEGRDLTVSAKRLMRDLGFNGDNQSDVEESLREQVQDSPLSVLVRSGWCAPGEQSEPEEWEILLSTGGPALRLVGDFNRCGEPCSCRLQYQDWGTLWTEHFGADQDALCWFAGQFYFGEF